MRLDASPTINCSTCRLWGHRDDATPEGTRPCLYSLPRNLPPWAETLYTTSDEVLTAPTDGARCRAHNHRDWRWRK